MSPEVRSWWAQQFLPGKYPGATEHLYIWNDMNEPSVFNGPEVRSLPYQASRILHMMRVSCDTAMLHTVPMPCRAQPPGC